MKKAWKDDNMLLREFNLFDRTKYHVRKMVIITPSKTKSGRYSTTYEDRKNVTDAFDTLDFNGLDSLKRGFKKAVHKSAENFIKEEYNKDYVEKKKVLNPQGIQFKAYETKNNEIMLEASICLNNSEGLAVAFNGLTVARWYAYASKVED